MAVLNIGEVSELLNDMVEAEKHYRRAFRLASETGDQQLAEALSKRLEQLARSQPES